MLAAVAARDDVMHRQAGDSLARVPRIVVPEERGFLLPQTECMPAHINIRYRPM